MGIAVALSLIWLPMVFDGLELAFGIEPPKWLGCNDEEENTGKAVRRWGTVVVTGLAIIAAGLGILKFSGALPSVWLPAEASAAKGSRAAQVAANSLFYSKTSLISVVSTIG